MDVEVVVLVLVLVLVVDRDVVSSKLISVATTPFPCASLIVKTTSSFETAVCTVSAIVGLFTVTVTTTLPHAACASSISVYTTAPEPTMEATTLAATQSRLTVLQSRLPSTTFTSVGVMTEVAVEVEVDVDEDVDVLVLLTVVVVVEQPSCLT